VNGGRRGSVHRDKDADAEEAEELRVAWPLDGGLQ
jgi:hypothetical protein